MILTILSACDPEENPDIRIYNYSSSDISVHVNRIEPATNTTILVEPDHKFIDGESTHPNNYSSMVITRGGMIILSNGAPNLATNFIYDDSSYYEKMYYIIIR